MRHATLLLLGALAWALPGCNDEGPRGGKGQPADGGMGRDAAPTELPEVPSGLVAEPGDGKVTLRWEASPGATRYDVERDRGCSGKFEHQGNVGTPTYIDTDVMNGTPYCYVVIAKNALGDSEPSEAARALPERAIVANDISATPSAAQVMVQWRRFEDATGYRLRVMPGEIALELSNTTTYRIVDGLANGTEYTFEVTVKRAGGTEASVGSATATPGVFPIVQVAAHSTNTCAVRESGHVLCWGANGANNLGDRFGIERGVPGLVLDIDDAVEIALGIPNCVRRASGGVICWAQDQKPPKSVPGIDDAAQLAAGSLHTCARRVTGEVVCWGSNGTGQLGDGTTTTRDDPAPAKGISDAIQVVSGTKHVCALRKSGEILCWGDNTDAQLGDGTTMARKEPTAVKGLVGAAELAAGYSHTCARRSNGEVYCWGAGKSGQLGNGYEMEPRKAPLLVAGVTDAVEIAAGYHHTCARKADGSVACWGEGIYGQLGNGTGEGARMPAVVKGVTDAVQITAGLSHTCARRASGEILCWGANNDGQLGDGSMLPQVTPRRVQGVEDVAQVALGPQHTCVRHTNGEVSCWGSNAGGQLGDGTKVSRYAPAKATAVTSAAQLVAGDGFTCALGTNAQVTCWGGTAPVTGLADIAELASSEQHTCARRNAGDVVCWGRNENGQLGDGTTTTRTTPVAVKGLSDATAIAVGSGHSCATRKSGGVVCWGMGGRIGDGTTTRRPEPTVVTGLTSPVLLRAGNGLTCSTDSAGAVSCWGGDRLVPTPLEGLSEIIDLQLDARSCAVRKDGGVQCWGRGQGIPTNVSAGSPLPPTAAELRSVPSAMLWGRLDVVQVAGATWHGCAVRADHTLDCWGQNDNGQLARVPSTTPRAVLGL